MSDLPPGIEDFGNRLEEAAAARHRRAPARAPPPAPPAARDVGAARSAPRSPQPR